MDSEKAKYYFSLSRGEALAEIRIAKGYYSLYHFENETGISHRQMSRYEKGGGMNPNSLHRILEFLNIGYGVFYKRVEELTMEKINKNKVSADEYNMFGNKITN